MSPFKSHAIIIYSLLVKCKFLQASALEKATFGAGCFWGPELAFQRVPGVLATAVGYSQGFQMGVDYEQVCTGITGHVEVVQVMPCAMYSVH